MAGVGLSTVATCTVATILERPEWKCQPEQAKKDKKCKVFELYQTLEDNNKFVNSNGLTLPDTVAEGLKQMLSKFQHLSTANSENIS